jgi:hypothetical protein
MKKFLLAIAFALALATACQQQASAFEYHIGGGWDWHFNFGFKLCDGGCSHCGSYDSGAINDGWSGTSYGCSGGNCVTGYYPTYPFAGQMPVYAQTPATYPTVPTPNFNYAGYGYQPVGYFAGTSYGYGR